MMPLCPSIAARSISFTASAGSSIEISAKPTRRLPVVADIVAEPVVIGAEHRALQVRVLEPEHAEAQGRVQHLAVDAVQSPGP